MTDTRLREALNELADSVPTPDLVTGRWQDASRKRHRRTALVAGASTLALVALVAALQLPSDSGSEPSPAPSPTPPPASDVTPDGPDATIAGHPVYLSPNLKDEAILPQEPTGVVPEPTGEGIVDQAVVAQMTPLSGLPFALTVLGRDGSTESLPVPFQDLDLYSDVNGTSPFTRNSLSPDGTRLALVTRTGFAIYDLLTDRWKKYPAPNLSGELRLTFRWARPDDLDLVGGGLAIPPNDVYPSLVDGFPLGTPWGPPRVNPSGTAWAGDWFSTSVTEVDAGYSNPEVISVDGEHPALLVMNGRGRNKGCCAVAGWLDDDWVVYESRFNDKLRLIAWNIRDGQFMRVASLPVSTFAGTGLASFADLPD